MTSLIEFVATMKNEKKELDWLRRRKENTDRDDQIFIQTRDSYSDS